MKMELLLEAITEAIREKRRSGPRFPTPFDLSHITWNNEERRIEMDLFVDGKIEKYDLLVDRVTEHGETSVLDDEESVETQNELDHDNLRALI